MSADPRIQEAIQLIKSKDKTNARKIVDALLTEYPSDANLWYLAAMTSGDRRDSIRLLNRALQLQPGHPKAKQALARLDAPIAISPPPEPEPQTKYEATRPVTGNHANARSSISPRIAAIILIMLLLLATNYASYQYGRETQKNDILNTIGAIFGGNAAASPTLIYTEWWATQAAVVRREWTETAAAQTLSP